MSLQVEQPTLQSGQSPGQKLTFEEFLRCYDGQHAELVDGEVILVSPISLRHDRVSFFLRSLIEGYLEERPQGVFVQAPFTMRLVGRAHGREPDLMFIRKEHLDRLKTNYVEGPADLVIEIISPESNDRDRGEKFREYEAAGILEYWIIDPTRNEALFYHLDSDGKYRRLEVDAQGDLPSVELQGFRLHVATLWQDPLPTMKLIFTIIQTMLK